MLEEVVDLIERANAARDNPLIVNIDIKNPATAVKCADYLDLPNVYFTSPNLQALSQLPKQCKIVPQINTKQLIAEEAQPYNLGETLVCAGVDCLLWDVTFPLLMLCKNKGWQIQCLSIELYKLSEAARVCLFYPLYEPGGPRLPEDRSGGANGFLIWNKGRVILP